MSNAIFTMPVPQNEPIYAYGPGSPEKSKLKAELQRLSTEVVDIPLSLTVRNPDGKHP